MIEKDQHEDWHFAKDLQDQEQNGAVASVPPAQAAPRAPPRSQQDLKQGSDSEVYQPPDYAPPSHPPPRAQQQDLKQVGDSKGNQPPNHAPPSYPPPQDGASRATARHHTNQVIEAAKIRARDEVNSSLILP